MRRPTLLHRFASTLACVTLILTGCATTPTHPDAAAVADIFLLPYFVGNGESGIYLAFSRDGLNFEWLNQGDLILEAPDWPGEDLTRDPSIVAHDGRFHMVWTTHWNSRSFGYATSTDLVHWSEPRKIDIWSDRTDVVNTWAPEIHWDPEQGVYLVIWSSTIQAELDDDHEDQTGNPHGLDHRTYATRTCDFRSFSPPELFYSTRDPELSVIDPYIAHDNRNTSDPSDDRWVMVIKNEMYEQDGGKNLRLVFALHMQGPYETTLGPAIVGAGTDIVNRMGEGPSLLKRGRQWWLYWDAPGGPYSYCLATSPDLVHWTNRSEEMTLPAPGMRHGTVLVVPESAVGFLVDDQESTVSDKASSR